MPANKFEMKFCRRCGAALKSGGSTAYSCEHGHQLFWAAAPAVALILLNDNNELLVIERAKDPGKGMWDLPGGFCDGTERLEQTLIREVAEEVGLQESDYTLPQFVLSAANMYEYDGESLPVLDVIFQAGLRSAKQPVAADDAAGVFWVPLDKLDLQKVAFPSVRTALERIIKNHK